jgi:hypothetical protein
MSYSKEESAREEGSMEGEDGTSLTKEENDTSEERSSREDGASDKRTPQQL